MHDINKFEATHRNRLTEIYESVKCPERTDTNWCGAQVGQPCRNMGATGGTLAAQSPRREPHQIRKLVAIEAFMQAAGVGHPVANAQSTVVKQTDIFDAEPAAWEKK